MNSQRGRAARLYLALLHYPVINKEGKVVTTAIVNADIHDISRAAKTYGVGKFYVINPLSIQRELTDRIVDHWRNGYGAAFNPSRKEAFETVTVRACLDDVVKEIEEENGNQPIMIVTGANFHGDMLKCCELKAHLTRNCLPYLLIFGTGHGIAPEILGRADFRLEPIRGTGEYNHLAVRSAVAIILDRITS